MHKAFFNKAIIGTSDNITVIWKKIATCDITIKETHINKSGRLK